MKLERRSNLLCPEIRLFFLGVLAATTKFFGFLDNHTPFVRELDAVKQWTIVNAREAAMSGASTPGGWPSLAAVCIRSAKRGGRRRSVESAVVQAQP
jgi:hypothetical protein